ncbi:MAG: DUF971 domain-containing protein [Planctomycetota bacterium]
MSEGELPVEGGRVLRPAHLDLDRERALTVRWSDGRVSIYPVRYLRKMSPSAEAKQLREKLARNPLTVLPSTPGGEGSPLKAEALELVGHYAVRIRFSDGHDTGIYSWAYLRQIDPNRPPETASERPSGGEAE